MPALTAFDVPAGLCDALATGNRWQDLLTGNFSTGRTGSQVLAKTRREAQKAASFRQRRRSVYGVVSHFVTRRHPDWGIRIALGMRPATVVRRIVGQGGALVAAGVALGTVALFVFARRASRIDPAVVLRAE